MQIRAIGDKNGQGEGDTTDGAVDAHVNADDIIGAGGYGKVGPNGRGGDGMTNATKGASNMASKIKEVAEAGDTAKSGIERGANVTEAFSTITSGNANEPDTTMTITTYSIGESWTNDLGRPYVYQIANTRDTTVTADQVKNVNKNVNTQNTQTLKKRDEILLGNGNN